MDTITVRPARPDDAARIAAAALPWSTPGATVVVAHDTVYDTATLPRLLAVRGGQVAGVLAYTVDGDGLEIVSIEAAEPGTGAGTALLRASYELAAARGLARVWLVTTNDNLDALRFYQRRGMRLVAVDPGAVDRARRRKPTIPRTGAYGIDLHDELHLEHRLDVSLEDEVDARNE
jgi:ribosomal protein S18 acetylase RimI-like enzyme